jgi:hypothetical protein
MGRLKPIGSEKLEGMDKITRIMEIARYKETTPNPINETTSDEYSVKLADGYTYRICREKTGYVIKKGLNESTLDYVEPMKNRRHYNSYSGAFKRLNLIAKEVNVSEGVDEEISLFTEQKKYILKTPKSMEEQAAPAPAPAPAPETEPAPAPVPAPEEMPAPEPAPEEMPAPESDEMPSEPENEDEEEISMKTIQKLTGKLAQKIRTYETQNEDEEMSAQDVKYVINSILSALDLDKLEEDDKEEIIDKVEGEGEEGGEEMMPEPPSAPSDEEMPSEGGDEMPTPEESPEPEQEMNEYQYIDDEDENDMFGMSYEDDENYISDEMIESMFSESKVDKIIKGYFAESKTEKKGRVIKENVNVRGVSKKIQTLSETKRQEESARKFVKNNPSATLIGKSNKNNLLFENNGETIKVTTNGRIL